MKYIEEYRDPFIMLRLAEKIRSITKKPWTIMEICGGQTHTIVKSGLESILPETISLLHGPGCPVCVTPIGTIDKAIVIASRPDVIFTSFGDMLRVPGSSKDLLMVKADGGDVRMIYSPLDALQLARQHPKMNVVFFAIGFETTAPANAMAVRQAQQLGIHNFFILCSHVLVPPAIRTILSSPDHRVEGFLAAGHVCAITGYEEYFSIAKDYRVPIVITGFEPVDILQGIYLVIQQLEEGRSEVENQYDRIVQAQGNSTARALMFEVFETCDQQWRGIGIIPKSGLQLKPEYSAFDAENKFHVHDIATQESQVCLAGLVLQGLKKPLECPAFGRACTPQLPLGAPMVSSEGACAAYYQYHQYAATINTAITTT